MLTEYCSIHSHWQLVQKFCITFARFELPYKYIINSTKLSRNNKHCKIFYFVSCKKEKGYELHGILIIECSRAAEAFSILKK